MCGRYSNASTNPQAIAARFKITISDATAERALGRTNIAPTQPVLAVVNKDDGQRQAILARFGLAPAWAKLRGGPSLINTRDDKLASSGAWNH
jgi:putative SOS response-associated peptidase YedK